MNSDGIKAARIPSTKSGVIDLPPIATMGSKRLKLRIALWRVCEKGECPRRIKYRRRWQA